MEAGSFTIKGAVVAWDGFRGVPPGPRVMITCPETGDRVWTGLLLDQASWDNAVLIRNVVECYVCGRRHTWNKEDAMLEGGDQ